MKKILLSITSILFATTFSFSQERDKGDIELIPNIGYSVAMVFGEDAPDLEPISSIQFGVLGDYYLNDRWSLRSGISYFTMGSSTPYTELELNYLTIPLNANWHFGSERHWNLNFGVSPQFLLKATADNMDVKEFYKDFQIAFSYGIGYKIEVSETFGILIDLQGLIGITNNLEDSTGIRRNNAGGSINVGGVIVL